MKKWLLVLMVLVAVGISGPAFGVKVGVTETFGTGETILYGIGNLPGFKLIAGDNQYVGVSSYLYDDDSRFMFVEHDSIVAAKVDTRGYEDLKVSYDIRSYHAESPDKMRVGWAVSYGTPSGWADFTQLAYYKSSDKWKSYQYDLPAVVEDTRYLWLAFYMDDGYGDYMCLDNLLVCADGNGGYIPPPAVPEPGTMLLLGSGLIGLVRLRRKVR